MLFTEIFCGKGMSNVVFCFTSLIHYGSIFKRGTIEKVSDKDRRASGMEH
jgi:hypothetical protein